MNTINLKNGEFYVNIQTIREIEMDILLILKLRTRYVGLTTD